MSSASSDGRLRRGRGVLVHTMQAVVLTGWIACLWMGLIGATPVQAQQSQELFVNGDLSQGAAGWFVATTDDNNPDNGLATWFLGNVGDLSPINGLETSTDGRARDLYLVTDQQIAARLAVFQPITIPPAGTYDRIILSFDMYVNDYANLTGFDPAQYARVDLITVQTPPLEVNSGIVYNAYVGTDGGPLPNPFFRHVYDVTGHVEPGQQYLLRFLANVNRAVLNVGVDNVSVIAAIPEPSSAVVVLMGIPMLALYRRRLASSRRG